MICQIWLYFINKIIFILKICFCDTILWVWLWKPDNLAHHFAPRALVAHTALLTCSQSLFWSKLVPLEAKCGSLCMYDTVSQTFALGDARTPSSHLFRTYNIILLSCCTTMVYEATAFCIHYFGHFAEEEHRSHQVIMPQGQRLWRGLKAALSPVLSCVHGMCKRALTSGTEAANWLSALSPLWCRYV